MIRNTNISLCHSSACWNPKQDRSSNHEIPDQVWDDRRDVANIQDSAPHCHTLALSHNLFLPVPGLDPGPIHSLGHTPRLKSAWAPDQVRGRACYNNVPHCHSSTGWNPKQDHGSNHEIPDQVWDDRRGVANVQDNYPHCYSSVGWNPKQDRSSNHEIPDQVRDDTRGVANIQDILSHCHSSESWNPKQDRGSNQNIPDQFWNNRVRQVILEGEGKICA